MTTENIQINVREDGSREVVVNINSIAGSATNAARSVTELNQALELIKKGVNGVRDLAKSFFEIVDTMTLLDARLKNVTRDTQDYTQAQKDLYRIAQDNNIGLKEATQLYLRLYEPVKRLGGGTKEVAGIVDAFSASLRLSGANTREAASATLQFSQAMGVGRLQGQDLKSIAESAPQFMRLLADSLGVSTAELKKMGAEGKLTADVIGNVLLKSYADLKKQSADMSNTVGGSVSDLTNDLMVATAAFDKLFGVSSTVIDIIQGMALVVSELGKVFKEEMADGTKVATDRMDVMSTSIKIFGTFLETILVLASDVSFVFKSIGREIGGISAQAVALAKGDFEAVKSIRTMMVADAEQSRAELDRYQARILTLTDSALAARDKLKEAPETDFATLKGKPIPPTKGLDDRLAKMRDAVTKEQMVFDQEKTIYENRLRMLDEYHKNFDTSETSFYTAREVARKEFIAAEQKSYEKEKEIIESFKPKTPKEVAENQLRLDKLLRQHEEFVNKMVGLRTDDEVSQLAYDKNVVSSSEDAISKYLSSQYETLQTLKKTTGAREVSAAAVEKETVAIYEQALANMKLQASMPITAEHTQADADAAQRNVEFLTAELNLRKGIVDELVKQQNLKFGQQAAEQAIKDWERVGNAIADSLSEAFGTAGKAIGQMYKAFATGQAARLRAEKQIAEAKKLSDDNPQKVKAIQDAQMAGAEAQLKMYGDMANAAKGFFSEGSRGYRAMDAAVKILHASEVALSLIKGVNAVLTQGEGDPYSAFARMAAMAAIVTGLGVALSGNVSGGGNIAATRQQAAGTGTVFGSSAKTDSIANSLARLQENSSIDLTYSSEMLATLRSIDSGINGLANVVIRSSGVISGKVSATGVTEGTTGPGGIGGAVAKLLSPIPLLGGIITKLFGTTTSVIDQGIATFTDTLKNVIDKGLDLQSYVDVQTKKKFLGITTSSKVATQLAALPQEVSDQFSQVIVGIYQSVNQAADLLGVGGDAFAEKLQSFVVQIDQISTKGLSGEEIQKQFENVFSKFGDELAQFGVDGLAQFQKVGEGYFETLVRIANDYQNVNSILAAVGQTMHQVGIESIAARENLIDLFGGIDKMAQATAYFRDNFLTAEEKIAPVIAHLTASFDKLGTTVPKSIEDYKNLALAQDLSTQAGRDLYATLLQLAPEFVQYQTHMTDAANAMAEAAQKAADAAKQAAQALADTLISNVQAAFQSLQKAIGAEKTRLTTEYQAREAILNAQISAVQTNISALKSASDAIHSTLANLRLSETALYDRMQAQGVLKQVIATKTLPESSVLNRTLSTLSKDSSDLFETSVDFQRDFYLTANDIADLGDTTDSQLDTAQQSLQTLTEQRDLLKITYDDEMAKLDQQLATAQAQIDLLSGINDKATSIVDAIANLAAAISAAMANSLAGGSAAIAGAYGQYLGRQPDQAGLNFYKTQIGQGTSIEDVVKSIANSPEAQINALYKNVLGRQSDVAGMQFYSQALSSGAATLDDIKYSLLASQEFMSKAPGFANGGAFGGGFRIVGERTPELEMTGPSRIHNADQMATMLGTDEIVAALGTLNDQVADLLISANKTATNTKQSTDMLDNVTAGGSAMLTQTATS